MEKYLKIFSRLLCVVVGIIFCTLIYVSKDRANAVETPIQGNSNEIKILEIEPGNKFLLGNSSKNELTLIGDCESQLIAGKTIKITHVTMAQFIGMVDEINGKYDVVVIGRKNDGLTNSYYSSSAPYLATKTAPIPYRDYTNPLSQKRDYLPLSTWEPQNNWKLNFSTVDNIKFGEYYAENDITQKRADEIIKMIDTKQLVYMESSIFIAGNNSITKTKLYNEFKDKAASSNFIKTSLNTITAKQIVDKYNSDIDAACKRPQVNKVTKPTDDSDIDAAVRMNRNMKFNITLDGQNNETLKANLYLDTNADGLFKDIELVKSIDLKEVPGQTSYELNYTLDSSFVGYLDWKIEIVRDNGIKTNILGSSKYKALTGKKKIKILQIRPVDSGTIDGAYDCIDFNTDKRVNDLIKNSKEVNVDYDLSIESKTVSQVNKDSNFKLNGNYDMVILGFQDSYGTQQLNSNVIDELEAFIKTGQSVMFTHDTITPSLTDQLTSTYTGPKKLTQSFRDYVGQARYPDPYRLKNGKVDETDIYKNYTYDSNGNEQLTDKIIPHDTFDYNKADDTSRNSNQAYSLGTTYQGSANGRSDEWTTSWDSITKVKKINSAQINEYPFELDDEIDVAPTHTQWYQLNLEDPDLVPWYNMSSNTFDTGDARNYYYTYSKGNITYSGAGHMLQNLKDDNGKSYYGYPTDELKLFVNTMIKAERGANHAPEIRCSIPKENTASDNETIDNETINEVMAGGKHVFTVDADDLEHEIVDMHVTIDGQELTGDNIQISLKDRGGSDSSTKNDKIFQIDTKDIERKEIEITIPDSKLQKAADKAAIEIDATDSQGAKHEKDYILKAVNAPNFQVNTELSTLTTVDNNDQNIDVPQRNGNLINIKRDNRVKAGYTIKPQSLEYGEAVPNGMQKEVAILIDTSMNDTGNKFTQSKNAIRDNLLNYYLSQDINNQRDDVKFDLIPYGNTVDEEYIDSKDKDQNGVPIDYRNELQTKLDGIKPDNSTQRSLGRAIGKAVEFFDYNNQENSGKTIIIISSGNPTDSMSDDDLKKISDNSYNILTLAIGTNTNDEENPYETLFKWHEEMGGLPEHYHISKPDSGGVYNDIKNVIAPKLAANLGSFKYKTYLLKDLKLNFNLGSNIILDKGLIADPNSYSDNEYIKNIPNIKYIAKEEGNPKKLVYYGYFQDETSTVNSSSYEADFIIRPAQDYSVSRCEFQGDNLLTYVDVVNSTIKNQLPTPVLILNCVKVDHGVYNGQISDGKAQMDKTGTLGFAIGSTVTFASNITDMNSATNLKIIIDPNTQIREMPKVYKIDGNKLTWLKTFNSNNANPQEFDLDFDGTANNNVVVVYSVVLTEDSSQYINEAKANDVSADAMIVQSKNKELPDLF